MRVAAAGIVVVTGCSAVFGLDDPMHRPPGDARNDDAATDVDVGPDARLT